jgi:hypothetical protein
MAWTQQFVFLSGGPLNGQASTIPMWEWVERDIYLMPNTTPSSTATYAAGYSRSWGPASDLPRLLVSNGSRAVVYDFVGTIAPPVTH